MSVKAYFTPEVVKTFKSKFNTKIQVVNFSGQLRLDMGDLTQSGQVIEKIWRRAFKKLLPKNSSSELEFFSVLVLGFGAGSVAKVISKKWPKVKITGVEIDPVVIKIAKKYFNVDKIPNLEIINQDAKEFVMDSRLRGNDKKMYDLILVDCYQGYKIPTVFENIKFLKTLNKIGGVVLVNRLFWDNHKQKTLEFLGKLNKSFTTSTCRTPSNLVIKYNESDVSKTKKSFRHQSKGLRQVPNHH
jgi:spermidine synthase